MTAADQAAPAQLGAVLPGSNALRTADGRLALRASKCPKCSQSVFPASAICPFCLHEQCESIPVASSGTLYTSTTVHVAPPSWQVPYSIGYADFEPGVRILSKLGAPGARWKPGQPVRLVVEERALPGGQPDAPPGITYRLEPEVQP